MDLREPQAAAIAAACQRELAVEISGGHPLHGTTWRLLARRLDCDDLALVLVGGEHAVVHLTWSGRTERHPWPDTRIYPDRDALLASYRDDDEA
jgi:hypothetical protein